MADSKNGSSNHPSNGKKSLIRRELTRSRGISRAVMMEHTIFSLPLAAMALLMVTGGRPTLKLILLVFLAVFGARNAANALNRLIDINIDRANPRTAQRDLPTGIVKVRDLWVFTIICSLLLIVSAALLNPLCLLLLPVAAVLMGGYSFTKRFTFLCHYWLGVTCAAATMGSYLAVTGQFEIRFFPLTAAAALWVAGFDILYALQDLEHDRKNGIHSVPAFFGRKGALIIAGLTHGATVVCLLITALFFSLGTWYFIGVGLSALLLLAQNVIAARGSIKWIPLAAYKFNQFLSPVLLIFTALDIFLPGGLFLGSF